MGNQLVNQLKQLKPVRRRARQQQQLLPQTCVSMWQKTPAVILAIAFAFLSEKEIFGGAHQVCRQWESIKPLWTKFFVQSDWVYQRGSHRIWAQPRRILGDPSAITKLTLAQGVSWTPDFALLKSLRWIQFRGGEFTFDTACLLDEFFEAQCLNNLTCLELSLKQYAFSDKTKISVSDVSHIGWALAQLPALRTLWCHHVDMRDFADFMGVLVQLEALAELHIHGNLFQTLAPEDLGLFFPIALRLECVELPLIYWQQELLGQLRLPKCRYAYLHVHLALPASIITFLLNHKFVQRLKLHDHVANLERVQAILDGTRQGFEGTLDLIFYSLGENYDSKVFFVLAQIEQLRSIEIGCFCNQLKELADGLRLLQAKPATTLPTLLILLRNESSFGICARWTFEPHNLAATDVSSAFDNFLVTLTASHKDRPLDLDY
jgi:hypothetical protein